MIFRLMVPLAVSQDRSVTLTLVIGFGGTGTRAGKPQFSNTGGGVSLEKGNGDTCMNDYYKSDKKKTCVTIYKYN